MGAITDPTAKALFSIVQSVSSDSGTLSNSAPLGNNSLAFSGKIDGNISSKDSLSGRYAYQKSDSKSPGLTFISSNLPTNGAANTNKPQAVTLNYTRVQGASMVINNIASFGRSLPNFTPLATFNAPSISFQNGLSELGSWSGLPQGRIQYVYNNLTSVTKTISSHTLKFGYNVGRIQANSVFDSNTRGTLTFADFAGFQTGTPVLYAQRFGGSIRGNRVLNHGFFLQDDYRVTSHLTLNLSVRGEIAGGTTEVNNIISNLDLSKQGVRGGYGIAYDFIFLNPITNLRFAPPFMYNFSTTDFTGPNSLANIVAGTSPFQQTGRNTVGNFGTTVRNFGSLSLVDQGIKNPQVQQWSLNVERLLFSGYLARFGYVATKGNFLQRARAINTIRPGLVTPTTSAADEAARRPEYLAINAALNAPPSAQTNRIDPRFTGVSLNESSANSNYHSFQAYLARSFRSGFGFTSAYTFAKSIDDVSDVLGVLTADTPDQQNPHDNRNNRALSASDVQQRFVLTHSCDLPALKNSNAVIRQVAGGWNVSGIFQTQGGYPINLLSGARLGLPDPILLGANGALRPNLNGSLNLTFEPNPGTVPADRQKVAGSNLPQPLIGNYGNLGRNVIRQNGLTQYDVTIQKNFLIGDRYKLQFQSQVANLMNNASFSRLGATLAAPQTFGCYQDTDTNSRVITLVLRLTF